MKNVRVGLPVKQGLKLGTSSAPNLIKVVRVGLPVKQGLKLDY